MRLNYRGISYEHHPAEVAVSEGKVGGKYRGRNWRIHNLKNTPIVKHEGDLIYRGVRVN